MAQLLGNSNMVRDSQNRNLFKIEVPYQKCDITKGEGTVNILNISKITFNIVSIITFLCNHKQTYILALCRDLLVYSGTVGELLGQIFHSTFDPSRGRSLHCSPHHRTHSIRSSSKQAPPTAQRSQ